MFSRDELEIAIGVTLAGAMILGWALHMIWIRLGPDSGLQGGRVAVMAKRLHEAELERDEAVEARLEAETLLAEREAEHLRASTEQEERAARAVARREAELQQELRELEADRDVWRDGLRAARLRVAELEREKGEA